MTEQLGTPWSLHFDRDGTEDYGIICDAQDNELVASHLPHSNVARLADRPFGTGCFWLPEEDGEPMPLLVRQMQLMTAAPRLLEVAMQLRAICGIQANLRSTATEAERLRFIELVFDLVNGLAAEAIAQATGQAYDKHAAEASLHMHRSAPKLYAALEACHAMLDDYIVLTRFVDSRLKPRDRAGTEDIEQARREAFAALCEARGEIAF